MKTTYTLQDLSGSLPGKAHEVSATLVIGRDPGCHIMLFQADAAMRHLALRPTDHGVVVERLEPSSVGVYINYRHVTSGILLPGDELWVGSHRFRLCGQMRALAP